MRSGGLFQGELIVSRQPVASVELYNPIVGEQRGVSPPVATFTGGLTPRRSPTCRLSSITQKGPFSIRG
jgi:hypothetical protein